MLKTNLSILAVVIGCLGVFTWVANAIPQIQSDVPEDVVFTGDVSELVASGEGLFQGAGGCTACHGLGERAPNLLTDHEGTGIIGVRCANRVAGQDCKQYLYTSLTDPNAYLVEGFAPIMVDASRTLSSTQIWALVAYLQSQGGESPSRQPTWKRAEARLRQPAVRRWPGAGPRVVPWRTGAWIRRSCCKPAPASPATRSPGLPFWGRPSRPSGLASRPRKSGHPSSIPMLPWPRGMKRWRA